MAHGPSADWGKDMACKYKTRVGLWMFFLYAIVYATFMMVNSFNPKIMGVNFFGVNVAIAFGYGLIFFALLLAFIYNALCTNMELKLDRKAKEVELWFDRLSSLGRVPAEWDRERVLLFCDALLALETEVYMSEGEANLSAIEAFQALFLNNGEARSSNESSSEE